MLFQRKREPGAAAGRRATAIAPPATVVQVVRSLETGGAEVMVAQLAQRLDRQRFRPVVFCLQKSGWLAEELKRNGVRVVAFHATEGLKPALFARIYRALGRERARLVHCHNLMPLIYAGLPALLRPGSQLLVTKHGAQWWAKSGAACLAGWLLRRAASVVAVSQDVRAALERWCEGGSVQTILNGIDTDRFRPRARTERARLLGVGEDAFVVGNVARLSPEKDHATLLRAFRLLVERHPNARLVIVGGGPLQEELTELARQLGLADPVRFLGERRDVPELLPLFDAFCLSSTTEGTSLVLLEAMATGLPVVATAVGGNPEVVADGQTGLLIPAGAPEPLAEALAILAQAPARRQAMGQAGRQRVLQHYSLGQMVRQYEALYDRLLR